MENAKSILRIRKLRKSLHFRIKEAIRKRRRYNKITKNRLKNEVRGEKHAVLAFREKMIAKLRNIINTQERTHPILTPEYAENAMQFMKDRAKTTDFVCACCACLFFESSVRPIGNIGD